MNTNCKDCRFFEANKKECRKNPPSKEGFQIVETDCWCGGFEGHTVSAFSVRRTPPKPREPVPELNKRR